MTGPMRPAQVVRPSSQADLGVPPAAPAAAPVVASQWPVAQELPLKQEAIQPLSVAQAQVQAQTARSTSGPPIRASST